MTRQFAIKAGLWIFFIWALLKLIPLTVEMVGVQAAGWVLGPIVLLMMFLLIAGRKGAEMLQELYGAFRLLGLAIVARVKARTGR